MIDCFYNIRHYDFSFFERFKDHEKHELFLSEIKTNHVYEKKEAYLVGNKVYKTLEFMWSGRWKALYIILIISVILYQWSVALRTYVVVQIRRCFSLEIFFVLLWESKILIYVVDITNILLILYSDIYAFY